MEWTGWVGRGDDIPPMAPSPLPPQVHTLLKGLEKIAASADIPMLVAGDFNATPGSAAHTLLVKGSVPAGNPVRGAAGSCAESMHGAGLFCSCGGCRVHSTPVPPPARLSIHLLTPPLLLLLKTCIAGAEPRPAGHPAPGVQAAARAAAVLGVHLCGVLHRHRPRLAAPEAPAGPRHQRAAVGGLGGALCRPVGVCVEGLKSGGRWVGRFLG